MAKRVELPFKFSSFTIGRIWGLISDLKVFFLNLIRMVVLVLSFCLSKDVFRQMRKGWKYNNYTQYQTDTMKYNILCWHKSKMEVNSHQVNEKASQY